MRLKYIFLFFLILLLVGCENINHIKRSYFYDFDKRGMIKNMEYMFQPFDSLDNYSNKSYNLYLSVRYSSYCKLKNLSLNIEYASLINDSLKNLNINIPLFDNSGNNLGQGNYGLFERDLKLLENQPYEEDFFLTISTPEQNTEGLISIGLILKDANL